MGNLRFDLNTLIESSSKSKADKKQAQSLKKDFLIKVIPFYGKLYYAYYAILYHTIPYYADMQLAFASEQHVQDFIIVQFASFLSKCCIAFAQAIAKAKLYLLKKRQLEQQ